MLTGLVGSKVGLGLDGDSLDDGDATDKGCGVN